MTINGSKVEKGIHRPFSPSTPNGNNGVNKFRSDIQALRGFAVLIVLFYHAKIESLSAGFLGVDVFFVISGYLMTRLVSDSLERGDFSFRNFYFRRARRLLPASYVTFLVTALLAPFFLSSIELSDFRSQMAGALSFTSNIFLWRQSGYFEGVATLKPLLHVWSLSIEEQFYFILPSLMFFLPRRLWKQTAIFLLLASLILCLYMVHSKAAATFYLLPTRAWELAIGCVGALMLPGKRLEQLLKVAFWPSVSVLLTLPFVKIANYHPGPDALLICLATLVIILRKHPLLFRGPAMHGLARIGDLSYSLYLVHWPLFAFLNNSWFGFAEHAIPPFPLRLGLLLLSLFLAWLLNRYVEEPARKADIKLTRRPLAYTAVVSLFLLILPAGITRAIATERDYAHVLRSNYGFGMGCEFADNFSPIPECRNSDQPRILIWGDSYAMHLVPGILGATDGTLPIIQATKSDCAPMLGVALRADERGWSEGCIDFNDSVISYLKNAKSIETVVLSSPFDRYVDKKKKVVQRDDRDGHYHSEDAGVNGAVVSMKKTVDKLRFLGKRVVVIAPLPSSGLDIGRCLVRSELDLPILGVDGGCQQISVDSWKRLQEPVLEFLAALPAQAGVEVIRPGEYLCNSEYCKTYIENTFIYRDAGHLSYEGSVLLAKNMGLLEKIEERAK